MKTLLPITAVILLGGCATYAELQEKPPALVAQTTMAPDAYIACAAPKFMARWGESRVMPDGHSRAIVIGNHATTWLTLTASPYASGSRVALRHRLQNFDDAHGLAQSCL